MQLARYFERLLDLLFPREDTARLVAECTPGQFEALLAPRILSSGVTALLPYRHPLVRAAIIEAKFHKDEKAFRLLSGVLAAYLETLREDAEPFEELRFVLLPIPLGAARLRARGYNQVEEVAKRSGYPVAALLERTRETSPQTSLSRKERRSNAEGAFAPRGVPEPSVTYVLLDDVTTTGATCAAASAVLGACALERIALAH